MIYCLKLIVDENVLKNIPTYLIHNLIRREIHDFISEFHFEKILLVVLKPRKTQILKFTKQDMNFSYSLIVKLKTLGV